MTALAKREEPAPIESERPTPAGERGPVAPTWTKPWSEQPEPPHNFEAEQALLGALLASNAAFDRVAARVSEADFYDPAHGRIFAAIKTLVESGRAANAVTLKAFFERDEGLAEVGGASYLARLQALSVAIINVGDYAGTIRDLRVRRRLMEMARGIYDEAVEPELGVHGQDLVESGMQALSDIGVDAATGNDREARTLPQLRQSAMARLELATRMRHEHGHAGLTTGLRQLDDLIGGLQPGELVLVAARPSMGKTSLGECIAWANARGRLGADGKPKDQRRVLFLSFEMSGEQLLYRETSRATGINSSKIRRGDLGETAFGQVFDEMRRLDPLPLLVDDREENKRLGAVMARARHAKRRGGLDLVLLDYVQLMEPDHQKGRSFSSKANEVAEITKGLKALARTMEVPVVALSQLSRENEKRENRRPQLSDLRDSGALEQDADVVIFIHREEYYLQREQPSRRSGETGEAFSKRLAAYDEALEAAHGRAELIVAKNRMDRIGTTTVGWDGEHVRFHDLNEEPGYGAPAGVNQGDLPL